MLTSGHIDLSYEVERELLNHLFEVKLEKLRCERSIAAINFILRDVHEGRAVQKLVALVKVDNG